MTDSFYIEQITMLLHAYAGTVNTLGKINLHDINVHSENFFRDFFNYLRELQLVNVNDSVRNEPGIDLADFTKKIIIQVSSKSTRNKLQYSLDKTDKVKYKGFHFYFLSLAESADNLRDKAYNVPKEISFNPATDIYDINGIIAETNSKPIELKKTLYDLTTKHLQSCITPQKNATSLAKVVEALDKASNSGSETLQDVPFFIPKKIEHNNLVSIKGTINDHVIYASMLNHVYETCEDFGKSTRVKIHSLLRRFYEENKGTNPADLYRLISDKALDMVMNSSNRPSDMMYEEIAWAVSVVVADAFAECKIFEHPNNLI